MATFSVALAENSRARLQPDNSEARAGSPTSSKCFNHLQPSSTIFNQVTKHITIKSGVTKQSSQAPNAESSDRSRASQEKNWHMDRKIGQTRLGLHEARAVVQHQEIPRVFWWAVLLDAVGSVPYWSYCKSCRVGLFWNGFKAFLHPMRGLQVEHGTGRTREVEIENWDNWVQVTAAE